MPLEVRHRLLKPLLIVSIIAIGLWCGVAIMDVDVTRLSEWQSSIGSGISQKSRYCSSEELTHADWTIETEYTGLAPIFDRYKLRPDAATNCKPFGSSTKWSWTTGTTADNETMPRIIEAATPMLRPKASCRVWEFDRYAVLKRLLRSSHGITVVGDSISQHTYNLLQDVLIQPDGLVVETVVGDQKVPTLSIDPAHPEAEALFDEAGVDASRARFPIVTFHRHNVLLSGPELELAFAGVNPPFNASDVQTQREDWFPLWSADVGQASAAHSTIDGVQEEPSVLLLNTGPHWQKVVMGRPDLDEADFKPAFRKMIELVSAKVRKVPVALYWRTTAPAHIDCDQSPDVDNARNTWASPVTGETDKWNYPWFPWQNEMAKQGFSELDSPLADDLADPFRLLDVWPMSMKRPDAHQGPPRDCLHWCMIGVMNHWQDLLWTMIFEQSRNQDYLDDTI